MKKKFLFLAVLLAATSVSALAVKVVTTCGDVVYTIDEKNYYASGAGVDGSYLDYLCLINYDHCGVYEKPQTFITEEGTVNKGEN